MEHGGNIRVANARRRPGFAEKTKPCRFITEISFTDDLQSHRAVQINVEGLVSDAHCTATQLEVVKSVRWPLRHRLECIPRRRLTGLNPASETLAKHAYWAEFHCFRKL